MYSPLYASGVRLFIAVLTEHNLDSCPAKAPRILDECGLLFDRADFEPQTFRRRSNLLYDTDVEQVRAGDSAAFMCSGDRNEV
jgi:hypothetical protein